MPVLTGGSVPTADVTTTRPKVKKLYSLNSGNWVWCSVERNLMLGEKMYEKSINS